MPNWRPDFDPDHLYFVTTTAAQHRRLFECDSMKRLSLDTLDCMRLRHRFKLYCFVIMPNHVHLIMQCRQVDPLAACVRDFKKQVADRMIRHLRAERSRGILENLCIMGKDGHPRYQVWEAGYLAKDVFSPAFLREKMTYIHENPCQLHWHLVDCPEEYMWSSAHFYLLKEPGIIPLDDASHLLI